MPSDNHKTLADPSVLDDEKAAEEAFIKEAQRVIQQMCLEEMKPRGKTQQKVGAIVGRHQKDISKFVGADHKHFIRTFILLNSIGLPEDEIDRTYQRAKRAGLSIKKFKAFVRTALKPLLHDDKDQ